MINFKTFAPILYTSERFVLGAIQFLSMKDAVKACAKCPEANADKLDRMKAECKKYREIAVDGMHRILSKEDFLYFLETYPSITNTNFAKFIVGPIEIKETFRSVYEISYNYNVSYLKDNLTPEDNEEYKQIAFGIREQLRNEYHW